ncbi:MAG: glycosyltransferase [Desulfuromonadaceae bacterium]|nr:glycosyltransferase [Desulfuromonadaceae bacterium]
MNIVMFTNTYTPHVGGVAHSVEAFTMEYRQRGHRTLVVAPDFPGMPENETDVLRIPAIQNFNGSDFSVVLPLSGLLTEKLDAFHPDIIHAHHPYLLGVTALRIARYRRLPLVFTHHTRYEEYSHYVPGNCTTLRRFIIEAATQYANLADRVIAPSGSIRDLLRERAVTTAIEVVPTGVVLKHFTQGSGKKIRRQLNISPDSFVVGHLGRLAPEKNIEFLAQAVAGFIKTASNKSKRKPANSSFYFLVIGTGPCEQTIRDVFKREGLDAQLHILGVLQQADLADALAAMDVFAFSSKSETQGMVLTEAMAARVPVVALDAPGVREVVRDRHNGRLLLDESVDNFVEAIAWLAGQSQQQRQELKEAARQTAEAFSMPHSADKALACYASLQSCTTTGWSESEELWQSSLKLIKAEWDILKGIGSAASAALDHVDEIKKQRGLPK